MNISALQNFLNCNTIFKPAEIDRVIEMAQSEFSEMTTNKKIKYIDVPAAFDIETSSFFRSTGKEKEKVAIMYEWTFGLGGLVIIGRTWDEFTAMIETIIDRLHLSEKRRLIVYIHNESFEFQFMRKWFVWDKVFSIDVRKPVYAVTGGIEFRCSYILSGYSLSNIGKQLKLFDIRKKDGDLDYNKIRHSETPLTETEMGYCANDAKVVMAYIAERMGIDGGITRIPLTKTGYVRNFCRESCFYDPDIPKKKSYKRRNYMELMRGLTLTGSEYKQLKRAFQGGFTHANPFYSGKLLHDVASFDFTSSYPCVMLAEKFPISSAELVEIHDKTEFERNIKLYCCLFDVEICGLESVILYDNYISISRCWGVKKPIVDNGRIVSAEHLFTTITEQDYYIIKKFYKWKSFKVANFRRYKKGYLPTDFVKSILKLYRDKTTLKGVSGKETEYAKSKEMLNSCYGMAVTDPLRPEIIYDNDWREPREPEIDTAIDDYNNSKSRFLFYPWGVWVTAYARRNLFTGICEFGNDYIYSDTDSIKVLNARRHMAYINRYNENIRIRLLCAMKYHGIPETEIEPETMDGIKKCLGVWDFDGHYSDFKTLGAKRYIVRYSNDVRNSDKNKGRHELTVSGLNKKVCLPWMLEKFGETGIFEAFSDSLYVPPEYTGKNTHTYIDDERTGIVTDYLGNTARYRELSGVHLGPADYSLSISQEYADYLMQVNEIEI